LGKAGLLRRQLDPGLSEELTMVSVSEADDRLMVQIGCPRYLQLLIASDRNLTDAGLAPITGLADIRDFWLRDTAITDTGLATIAGLTNLRKVNLARSTSVTDAGLARLASLRNCKEVTVTSTNVTPAGIGAMKAKCPWMTIYP
jgi:hypothetical protein